LICPTCDLLTDVRAEEAVISTMMTGSVKVHSLPLEAFTCPVRREVYRLLREGVPYENLEGELRREGLADNGYLADLFLTPCLGHKPLLEAIDDLKRLALLRPLCEAVEGWLKRAPHMPYQKAVLELGKTIRSVGSQTGGQTPSSSPIPR
jgi:hypothetical protein